MRIALIDLGTNAVRFDVHDIDRDGTARRLHRERLGVRLGEGVFRQGRLTRPAMDRALAAFRGFQKTCRDLRVEKTVAFGTSALRDSANSDHFLRRVKRETGFDVRVISGREEARLIAQGVLAHDGDLGGPLALVDIGGGSVEISLCRNRRVRRAVSLKLGASRLQQIFLKTIPPARAGGENAPVAKLRRHIRSLLAEGAPRGGWPRVERLVGSAGAIRTLARLHRAHGDGPLNAKTLRRLSERLEPLSAAALARVPGMDPKRVETILAGAVVLEEIAGALGVRRIEPTDYSLRDGMLEEETRAVRRGAATSVAVHLDDIFERARRWGQDARHLRHVETFARTLFDRLAPLHGLSRGWRDALVAAADLQDVGEWISPVHHERHSAYMIENADWPGLDNAELAFIARLVLWHKGGKVEKKDLPFAEAKRRGPFFKLLSLLRIVDALEKAQSPLVRLRAVHRTRGRVVLSLAGARAAVDLAVLRVEQKKELFEKTFRVALAARAAL